MQIVYPTMENSLSKILGWAILSIALSLPHTKTQAFEKTNLIKAQNAARKMSMDILGTKEQACYMQAIKALIELLQHQDNELPKHHKLFGDLEYFYPKTSIPITRAYYYNVLICKNIDLTMNLSRKANEPTWTQAYMKAGKDLSIQFLPNLSKEIFDSLNLTFVKIEPSKDSSGDEYFVYQASGAPKLLVKFYVEAQYREKGIDYPKNFTFVDMHLVRL